MTRRKRRNHTASFKAKVALAAVRGEHTLAELADVGAFVVGATICGVLVLSLSPLG